MLRYSIYIILFCFLLANSCKSGSASNNLQPDRIEMELIVAENYSGFEEEQFIVIKNQEALLSFYGKVNRTRKPGLTPPDIDFSKEMLLVWCGGAKVTGHSKLELISTDENLVVNKMAAESKKNKDEAIVSPFTIYKLPLTSKKLVFQ